MLLLFVSFVCVIIIFFLMIRRPPRSTLFPSRRSSDLFLSLGYEHEIDRQLAIGAAIGVQRREEGGLRPFLIDGAAADDHLAEPRLVQERRFPRRGRPLGGVYLLDVVHEVESQGARRAGLERGEDAGLPVG